MKKQLFVMSLMCVASSLPADAIKSSDEVRQEAAIINESKDSSQQPSLMDDNAKKETCAKLIVLDTVEGELPKAPQTSEPVSTPLAPQIQDALSSK